MLEGIEILQFQLLRHMGGIGIKAKVWCDSLVVMDYPRRRHAALQGPFWKLSGFCIIPLFE